MPIFRKPSKHRAKINPIRVVRVRPPLRGGDDRSEVQKDLENGEFITIRVNGNKLRDEAEFEALRCWLNERVRK